MKLLKNTKGEGILTFIAMLPFVILVLLLAVQVVIIGYSKIALQHTAKVAVEKAIREEESRIIPTAIQTAQSTGSSLLYDFLEKSTITPEGDTSPGEIFTVKIEYNFPKFSVITSMFRIPADMTVKAQASAVVQEVP